MRIGQQLFLSDKHDEIMNRGWANKEKQRAANKFQSTTNTLEDNTAFKDFI